MPRKQPPSSVPGLRFCEICRVDISHRSANAKTCGSACAEERKAKYRAKERKIKAAERRIDLHNRICEGSDHEIRDGKFFSIKCGNKIPFEYPINAKYCEAHTFKTSSPEEKKANEILRFELISWENWQNDIRQHKRQYEWRYKRSEIYSDEEKLADWRETLQSRAHEWPEELFVAAAKAFAIDPDNRICRNDGCGKKICRRESFRVETCWDIEHPWHDACNNYTCRQIGCSNRVPKSNRWVHQNDYGYCGQNNCEYTRQKKAREREERQRRERLAHERWRRNREIRAKVRGIDLENRVCASEDCSNRIPAEEILSKEFCGECLDHGPSLRKQIPLLLRVHGSRCYICTNRLPNERELWHVHHVHPRSLGGTDHIHNLRLTCASCNVSLNNRMQHGDQFALDI